MAQKRRRSKGEIGLRRAFREPVGNRSTYSRGALRSATGLAPLPLVLETTAAEVLELGDAGEPIGLTSSDLALRLLQCAWEALYGRKLGWTYALDPQRPGGSELTHDFARRLREIVESPPKAHQQANLSPQEVAQEPGSGSSSDAVDPKAES